MTIAKKLITAIFIIMTAAPLNAQAKTGDLAVGIASDHIDITVGFTGSSIELFGDRRNKNADIAIVVEGPERDITIWQKARVMGTWVNRYYVTFENIPAYYHHALHRQVEESDISKVVMENGIGHDALFHKVQNKDEEKEENIETFQKALLKKTKELGVFFENPAEIKFLSDNFFRVRFDIPPSAPTGEYKIRSFLIEEGKIVENTLDLLKVEQVGLNAFIYKAAQTHSLLYALICIFLALFFGWLFSALRVRP